MGLDATFSLADVANAGNQLRLHLRLLNSMGRRYATALELIRAMTQPYDYSSGREEREMRLFGGTCLKTLESKRVLLSMVGNLKNMARPNWLLQYN